MAMGLGNQAVPSAPREGTVFNDINHRLNNICTDLEIYIRTVEQFCAQMGRPPEGSSPVPIKQGADNTLDLITLIEGRTAELRMHLRRLDPNV